MNALLRTQAFGAVGSLVPRITDMFVSGSVVGMTLALAIPLARSAGSARGCAAFADLHTGDRRRINMAKEMSTILTGRELNSEMRPLRMPI